LDVVGKKLLQVDEGNFSEGHHKILVNRNQLSTGIYFFQIVINNESFIKKVVVN